MVEAATRPCQPLPAPPPEAANPNWDAVAVSLTSQANAISIGAAALAVGALLGGIAWGRIIGRQAEREARQVAEQEVEKWIKDEGIPMLRREVAEFQQTFPRERPISEADVEAMVAAVGENGKEGFDGKE
ncbi:hypothetical protein [Brevundimonas aurantiaca]|jgi:hypothetical protein|uniref:Uncharacterized protein n=1 Tax=Brevundimonas aurantiaca TaxID=74316 RepID=A0A7W9F8R6_9CAUL|nr:hypothetical protein [Brevundimonas aurantiaca]MBB5740411.1 hypothetical protein [Brevundimonas aurantiaca]